MGCTSSKESPSTAGAPGAGAPSVSGAAPLTKSLSNFGKTKGGSMLLNLADKKMIIEGDDAELEFADTQHITSPPTVDWKTSKTVRKVPEMKETVKIPIKVPEAQGGGVVQALVGYRTLQGKNPKPPHKPNQDCLSIFIVEGHPNLVVFTCFDGHGPFGEHASHYCRANLHPAMKRQGDDLLRANPRQAFINALADVHASFCSSETLKSGVDPVVSGTTCVGVLFDGKEMHIANVGDSRAILGKMTDKHELVTEELTDDHKPQRPDERARLEKTAALLLTEREVRGFGDDSKIYICRERGGDIVYGVLFTRSLGDADAHEHLGVSSEPEMATRTLQEEERYIVLASDGVWDYMENDEVMSYVQNNNDPVKASQVIMEEAAQRWEVKDVDRRRDDITVLVIRLEILEPMPEIDSQPTAEAAREASSAKGGEISVQEITTE